MARLDDLRAAWERASEKDKPKDAVKALLELEKLEPKEARWSQRLGESYRRLGNTPESAEAFTRAFERYLAQGFLPRAIAMAKLVKSLDAARGDLLEASLPQGAPGVPAPAAANVRRTLASPTAGVNFAAPPAGKHAEPPRIATPVAVAQVKAPPAAQAKPVASPPAVAPPPAAPQPRPVARPAPAPAPAPVVESPRPAALQGPLGMPPEPPPLELKSAPVLLPLPPTKPVPLTPAADSSDDEIRFEDAPDSSVEILLEDYVNATSSVVLDADDLEEEDDAPATVQVSKEERAREPEIDAQATMATVRLFASLTRDAVVALANASELVEFVPGAMIIVRDERAFALYAIVAGNARVVVKDSPAQIVLKEGDIFGEASLLDEGHRQADVRADTPLMTLRIDKRALDAVVKEHPDVEDALFDLLARRLIMNLMQSSPLFASFDPAGKLELGQKFEVRRAPANTILTERGRRSDGLYVILAGDVRTDAATEGGTGRIARGTAFGHASLLGTGPANETITAVTEAVLLRLPASQFSALAAQYPPVLAHLADTADEPLPMSQRLV